MDPNNPDFHNTPASERRRMHQWHPEEATRPPLVTILTAFFNTGEVFHETAQTIFRQTLQQWEWIIVNDASTDPQALAVLRQYREMGDPRIRVIDLERNAGPSAARNCGVELAATEYVYHLDSDDLIEPTTLEKCFWFLFSHPDCPWVNGWSVGFGAEEYLWHFGYHNREKFLEQNLVTGRTMIRKSVHLALGGYDESIRGGFEDWAFWLKAAEQGLWGATIPEYFDWYRRRESHWNRWETIHHGERTAAFKQAMPERFPRIYGGTFPEFRPAWQAPFEEFVDHLPGENRLKRTGCRRLLLVVPWMAMGGADKFNLDLVEQLSARGWEITLVTTKHADDPWLHLFEEHTRDIFDLFNAVHPRYHPLCLRYLIASRQPDAVLITGSEMGYWLLPYLRHHFPATPFLDYSHIEETYWKNGGYPRYAARNQDLLELNLVSSQHLRDWMVSRCEADPDKIEVVHTNIDAAHWAPCPTTRRDVRAALGIAEDMPLILFAGRICPQKQPEVLARVIHGLDQRGAAFRILIAGDGEDMPWLKAFLGQHRLLERVILTGAVSQADVRRYMRAADIYFLPSLWEGIALSVYEAMATGVAVVGARVGGQAELVTADTGVLIERPEADPLAEVGRYVDALSALIGDAKRRREMGEAAARRIRESFTLDRMTDAMEAAFERTAAGPRERTEVAVPRRFAVESAVRAIEYFRIEGVADRLWSELQNKPGPPSKALSAPQDGRPDPLSKWNRIHRYIPFRFYRWIHTGWRGRVLPAEADAPGRLCHDESRTIEERMQLLTLTRFYQRIMSLRRWRIFRTMLPDPF